jgi:hypothetical protein
VYVAHSGGGGGGLLGALPRMRCSPDTPARKNSA